jgi:kynurenine 3-monooxygenase
MRHAGQAKLIDHVMGATIPMRGRMIHAKRPNGDLYEEAQDYDVHGRVSFEIKSLVGHVLLLHANF